MGCGVTKSYRNVASVVKKSEQSQEIEARANKFSLYTVREELSEMEQSHLPSKRQSILGPLDRLA